MEGKKRKEGKERKERNSIPSLQNVNFIIETYLERDVSRFTLHVSRLTKNSMSAKPSRESGKNSQSVHLISIIFIITLTITLYANAAFDDDFTGARARGMGGAFTALADDADGLLTNPAGLSHISAKPSRELGTAQQLTATMATLYAGLSDGSSITQNLVGYAHSQPQKGAIGFIWKRLSVSNLYSENIFAIGLAKQYSFGVDEKMRILSVGGTIRLLHWSAIPIIGADGGIIEDIHGRTNIGFDAGLIFRPAASTPIAIALHNLNRPNIASENASIREQLPISVQLGIAASGENATWAMDLVFIRTQVDVRTGFEWQLYQDVFTIRMGFRLENLAWGTNVTFGASFRPNNSVRIDYAFVYPVGNVMDTFGSHRVSIVYDF